MNLIPHAPWWLLAILFAAMAAAAIEDFLRLRISNITCAVVFVAALVAMGLEGFSLALWQNAAVFAFLLVCGTLLFMTGKFGGGDVKLFAALGLWVDLGSGIWLIATSLLAGGVLAVIYITVRYFRGGRNSKGIPYGLALVAGAGLIFAGQLGLMKPHAQPPNPLAIPLP